MKSGAQIQYVAKAPITLSEDGTYTIGGVDTRKPAVLTIVGDDGITLTPTISDAGAYTWAVSGLKAGAVFNVASASTWGTGQTTLDTFKVGDTTLDTTKTYIATGATAATAISEAKYLIEVPSGGTTLNVWTLNDNGSTSTKLTELANIASISSGTITLGNNIAPISSKPFTVINNSTSAVTLKAGTTNGGTTYATVPASTGGSYGIQTNGTDTFTIVQPTGSTGSYTAVAQPTSAIAATYDIGAGQTFVLDSTGFKASGGNVTVASDKITVPSSATTITGAATGKTIELTATGEYTINGVTFTKPTNASVAISSDSIGKLVVTATDANASVVQGGLTYTLTAKDNTVTIGGAPSLSGTINVTGTPNSTSAQSFSLANGGTYKFGGITIDATSASGTVVIPAGTALNDNFDGSMQVNGKIIAIPYSKAHTIVLSENGIDSITNVAAGATISSAGGATSIVGVEAGDFTIGGKKFTVTGGAPTFTLNSGAVTAISGVTEVTGDFTTGLTVRGKEVKVTGDSEITFNTTSGISGLNSGAVVANAGGATSIVTNSEGTFTIDGVVYTVEGDDSVTFTLEDGKVTDIALDKGTLKVEGSSLESVKVNGVTYATTGTASATQVIVSDLTSIIINGGNNTSSLDVSSLSDVSSYYVDVTAGTISALSSAGTILATLSSWDNVVKIDSGKVTLSNPQKPIYINGTATEIVAIYDTLVSQVSGFTGFKYEDSKLSLATITAPTTSTAISTADLTTVAGSMKLAANKSIYATSDYVVTDGGNGATVKFGSGTLDLSNVATVAGAPASTKFTLGTSGDYTLNGRTITGEKIDVALGTDKVTATVTLKAADSTFTDATTGIVYTGKGTYAIAGDNSVTLTGDGTDAITVTGTKDTEHFKVKGTVDFKADTFIKEVVAADSVDIDLNTNGLKVDNNVNKVVDVRKDADGYVVNVDSSKNITTITGIDAGAEIWSFGAVDSNVVSATSKVAAMTDAAFTFVNGTFKVNDSDGDKNGITFMAGNDNKVIKLDGLDENSKVTVGAGDYDADLTYSALQVNGTSFKNVAAGVVITGTDSGKYAKIDADGYLIDVGTATTTYRIMQNNKAVADTGSNSVVQDTTFKLINGVLDSSTAITTIVETSDKYGLTHSGTTLFSGLSKLQVEGTQSNAFFGVNTTVDKDGKASLALVSKDEPFSSLSELPAFNGGLTIYSDASLAIAASGSSIYNIASLNKTAIEFSAAKGTGAESNTYIYSAGLTGAAKVTNTLVNTTFTLSTDTNLYTINGAFFKVTETATVNATADPQTATLYAGTVVLDFGAANDFVQATASGTATVNSGTVFAKAAEGKLTQIENIDVVGEKFTVNYSDTTKLYQMTAYGLAVASDTTTPTFSGIYEDITTKTAVFALDTTATATAVLNANGGALTLASNTGSAFFVETPSTLEKFYTKLTVDGNKYTFEQLDGTATSITATAIKENATFDVGFDATVYVGADGATNTFTVNAGAYKAISALEIFATGTEKASALNGGTVIVDSGSELKLANGSILKDVKNDADGVIALASEGTLNSIKDLEDGVSLVYSSTTYAMAGNVLKVTSSGTTLMYAGANTDTNVLEPNLPAVAYLDMTSDKSTIVLSSGTSVLSNDVNVLFGTSAVEDFKGAYFATFAGDTGTNIYSLTANGAESSTVTSPIVNVNGVGTGTGLTLTTDFAAQVLAGEGATTATGIAYTINNTKFNAAGALTLKTTKSSGTTIFDGVLTLDSTTYKAATASAGETATAIAGTVFAKAANGKFTQIAGIDEGESFSVNDDVYKQTADGLLKGTKDGYTGIDLTFESGTYKFDGKFTNLVEAANGAITFTTATAIESAFVNSLTNPETFYAKVSSATGTVYTFDGLSGAASATELVATNFDDGTAFKINFDLDNVQVGTADSATTTAFTVNSVVYNAYDILTVTASGTGTTSTLTDGNVQVKENADITATKTDSENSGKKISVTGDDNGVKTKVADGVIASVTDLDEGGKVTLTDDKGTTTYERTDNKLKVTTPDGASKRYAQDISTETDILNFTGSVGVYVQIEDGYTLNLNSGISSLTKEGDEVGTVDYGTHKPAIYDASGTHFAELTQTTTSVGTVYTFEQNLGSTSETLKQKAVIDGTGVDGGFALNLDFDANIKTSGTNVFTINGVKFSAASELTLTATAADSSSALFAGTVHLNDTYTTVAATTSGTATFSAGDGILATAADGKLSEISGINTDDIFTAAFDSSSNAYKMTKAGLLKGNNTTSFNGIWLDAESSLTAANATSFIGMIGGSTTITLPASVATGTSVVVDNTNDPTKFYTIMDYTSGTTQAFTFKQTAGKVEDTFYAIDATAYGSPISVNVELDKIAVFVGAGSADGVKYTVNSDEFNALTEIELKTFFNSTSSSSGAMSAQTDKDSGATLQNGSVQVVDKDVKTTNNETVSVTGDSDGVKATAEQGSLTSVTGLDVGGTLTLASSGTTTTYTMTDGIVSLGDALYKADSSTNLLALDSSTALAYVQLTSGDAYGVNLASGTYTVADTTFNAVNGLTIDFDKTTATLYQGTVELNSKYKDVAATASETVTATTENEIDVVVEAGKVVSFGALDYSGNPSRYPSR